MVIRDKINLRIQRDFTELFNAVFYLARRNFKLIAGALLMVGGPFVLFSSVITGFLQINVLSRFDDLAELIKGGKAEQYLTEIISSNVSWILLAWILGLLTFSFIRAVMINFVLLYDSKLEGEELTSAEIASKSFRDGFTIFVNLLALTLLAILPLLMLLTLLIFSISSGSAASVILIAFFFILAVIAFGPQLTYIFSFSVWFTLIRDKLPIFSAVKNTFKNIKGNFWWIWVLMVSMFFLVTILNYVTSLPASSYFQNNIAKKSGLNDSSTLYVYLLLFVIAQIGSFFFQCLGDLLSYLTFFSLEEGQKKQESIPTTDHNIS